MDSSSLRRKLAKFNQRITYGERNGGVLDSMSNTSLLEVLFLYFCSFCAIYICVDRMPHLDRSYELEIILFNAFLCPI